MNYFTKLALYPIFVILNLYPGLIAADLNAGKEKAEGVCAGCHGNDGVNGIMPSYPIIAGQHEDYLLQALTDYKSGSRKNAVMAGIASTLTKEDIINLSAYFSQLPGPLYLKKRQ